MRIIRSAARRGIALAAIYLLLAQAILTGLSLGAHAGWRGADVERLAATLLCAPSSRGKTPAPSHVPGHNPADLCCLAGCLSIGAAAPPRAAAHLFVPTLRPAGPALYARVEAEVEKGTRSRWPEPRGPPGRA